MDLVVNYKQVFLFLPDFFYFFFILSVNCYVFCVMCYLLFVPNAERDLICYLLSVICCLLSVINY